MYSSTCSKRKEIRWVILNEILNCGGGIEPWTIIVMIIVLYARTTRKCQILRSKCKLFCCGCWDQSKRINFIGCTKLWLDNSPQFDASCLCRRSLLSCANYIFYLFFILLQYVAVVVVVQYTLIPCQSTCISNAASLQYSKWYNHSSGNHHPDVTCAAVYECMYV